MATCSESTSSAARTGSREAAFAPKERIRLLDDDRFFDRLDEVRRFARSRQLFGLLIGFLLLAVLVKRDPLQRLIEHAPERLQPYFFCTLSAALALGRFLLDGGGLLRRGLSFLFSGLDFGAFFLATSDFGC